MIVGTSWIRLELDITSWNEQKRRKEMLNHNPADWIGTSSRLDSKAETPKLKIEESSRLDGDPGDWIN